MTFDEKIKALNDLAIAWYSTSQADTIHEAIFRGQGYGKFADHCKEEAEEELEVRQSRFKPLSVYISCVILDK